MSTGIRKTPINSISSNRIHIKTDASGMASRAPAGSSGQAALTAAAGEDVAEMMTNASQAQQDEVDKSQ